VPGLSTGQRISHTVLDKFVFKWFAGFDQCIGNKTGFTLRNLPGLRMQIPNPADHSLIISRDSGGFLCGTGNVRAEHKYAQQQKYPHHLSPNF
jgi:hypothetical protein